MSALHGAVQVYLSLLHVMIHSLHREHFRHVVVVGYSGVVFAWMTLVASGGTQSQAYRMASIHITPSCIMLVPDCGRLAPALRLPAVQTRMPSSTCSAFWSYPCWQHRLLPSP